MVIGLGGIGTQVIQRIKTILTSRQGSKVPESLRLLAFDVLRPATTTGQLGSTYPFLFRLAPGEVGVPTLRQMSRQVMINDLKQGESSSITLRELSANMDALRRGGTNSADIFIVSSSFGLTGTAWLLDIANLCQYFCKDGQAIDIHALLITPEAFQNTFSLTAAHRQINYTALKELEALQKKHDWGEGFALYDGEEAGGIPGILRSAPFATIQLVDGQNLGGPAEHSAAIAAVNRPIQSAEVQKACAEARAASLQNILN